MRRLSWDILLALLAGLGLGLGYAWVISPVRVVNSEPVILRADFKAQYRSAIAAAYAATGNLPRAQARLAYLGDPDPAAALNAQAQQMLASGESAQQADQVALLARALTEDEPILPAPTETTATELAAEEPGTPPTSTLPPAPPEIPLFLTGTPETVETEPATEPVIVEVTPRPTRTPIPTPGAPFKLTGQETVCDPNLPDSLLQVIVYNSNRRQLAGVKLVIAWDGGGEQFFTGFKPELGNGYADFVMSPNVTYSLQLARGSDIASGLTTPTCETASGETFFGGIKLTFQQP